MGNLIINEARLYGIAKNDLSVISIYCFNITNSNFLVKSLILQFCKMGELIRMDAWVLFYDSLSSGIKNLLGNIIFYRKRVLVNPLQYPSKRYVLFI